MWKQVRWSDKIGLWPIAYISTQREVLEGQTGSHRAKELTSEGGSGGRPPENFKNLHCKWCNLRYSWAIFVNIISLYCNKTCINYASFITARANVKTLRPTFQLSNLGAVDGGLGLWLSLGIFGSVDPINRYPYPNPNHSPNPKWPSLKFYRHNKKILHHRFKIEISRIKSNFFFLIVKSMWKHLRTCIRHATPLAIVV